MASYSALAPARSPARPDALANWLLLVAALVFAMLVVGGITRLTESGLSITQWKPITGAIPPLDEAAWAAEFERYRQIPEYRLVHHGMTLEQFKHIYFWEWLHRLIGRVIGLAFAVPLALFAWRRAIPPGYGPRLLALLALGGLQGAAGWWMVQSGLSVRTDVSHIRLSIHLLLALCIMGGLIWTALDLRELGRDAAAPPARLRLGPGLALAVLTLQLLLGAWVAGLDAGYVASDWPLMQGRFVPDGIDWSQPAPLMDDPFLVHFVHRWGAWAAAIALLLLARAAAAAGDARGARLLVVAIAAQITLGIATVLSGVDIVVAVAHQAMGALLVAAAVRAAHAAGRRQPR
jgi:cytochrome c oxidase assembly protein subunit 15